MIGRNQPTQAVAGIVTLQWANGKAVARETLGTGRFAPYFGFHIEVGKWKTLDEVLDEIQFPCIEIKHQRPGGAEIVRHWSFGCDISLLPITSGPVGTTMADCLSAKKAPLMAEAGIGVRWPDGGKSQLAVRGFVRQLWDAEFCELVQFTTKSRMTDEFLKVLLDHTRIAEATDVLVRENDPTRKVAPAELWLPLGAGEDKEFGKGDTATVVPVMSRHPETPSREYLKSIWRSEVVWKAVNEEWRGVQEWAAEFAEEREEFQPKEKRQFDRGTGEVCDEPVDNRRYGRN